MDLMNKLYGPLGKEYCTYFYILSIFFFLSFIVSIVFTILQIVKNPKIVNMKFVFTSLAIIIYTLIPYYVNRLLYTMCINSLH